MTLETELYEAEDDKEGVSLSLALMPVLERARVRERWDKLRCTGGRGKG